MTQSSPHVIVIAGPNGSGKSTTAPALLRDLLGVAEYVNADLIAQGLSSFNAESVAFQAGKLMIKRLHQLAEQRKNFAFETTLATRSYLPWLRSLQLSGYKVDLVFLWLPSADIAVARVAERVRMGGHNVRDDVVIRRFERGVGNFFELFSPAADRWWFFDNSGIEGPRLVASGEKERPLIVADETTWNNLRERYQ